MMPISIKNKLLHKAPLDANRLLTSNRLHTKNVLLSTNVSLESTLRCRSSGISRDDAIPESCSAAFAQKVMASTPLLPVSFERVEWDQFGSIDPASYAEVCADTEADTTRSIETFDSTTASVGYEELEDIKMELLQILGTSLIDGKGFKNREVQSRMQVLVELCSRNDPEFILKAALYCRRELNIRLAGNTLLALAFHKTSCYTYISKYFSAIVCLPSDWLSIVDTYKATSGSEVAKAKLPAVLRRNLIAKFPEFDLYQLAKYNKKIKTKSKKSKSSRANEDRKSVQSTMKSLIRTLHISSPRFQVMCILGKPYPKDPTAYIAAGLEGEWDSTLAGKRMKLPPPETWETVLSSEGNTSSSWESLISSGKLPYMAMLRNLRNIIKAGVSQSTHDAVLGKLVNPRAVIGSKQLPFRFFSAYQVLEDMKRKLDYNTYLQRLLKMPTSVRMRNSVFKQNESTKLTFKPLAYNDQILLSYRKAVGRAIEIAVRNNVPPIRGSVLIVCTETEPFRKTLGGPGLGKHKRSVGTLLGLMCASASEAFSMYISYKAPAHLVPLDEYMKANQVSASGQDSTILSTARQICNDKKGMKFINAEDLVQNFYATRQHFDTVFVLGKMLPAMVDYVAKCRSHFGPVNAVWSDLDGSGEWPSDAKSKSGWFVVKGNTDMVLRYIAEASNQGLLAHVERIDELYGLNRPPHITVGKKCLQSAVNGSLRVERPISEWRCCRVFVSSTFRDMHAERDLICGLLLPSIRQFAVRELRVHVNEVDLRWGVPESVTQTPRALEMCFEQACNADLFILLVGERYGWVPNADTVAGLPGQLRRRLDKFYESNMSVTEMEYRIMKQSAIDKIPAHQKRYGGKEKDVLSRRIFAFFRDPAAVSGVPSAQTHEFVERNPKKRERLQQFKKLVRSDGVVAFDNYPAFYNGVVAGRHVMGNLTALAENMYRCLRQALTQTYAVSAENTLQNQSIELPLRPTHELFMSTFVEPVANAIAPRQLLQVERSFIELEARGKQCHAIRQFAEQSISTKGQKMPSRLLNKDRDGAVLLITGSTGCGKTTHMAALAASLSMPGWYPSQYEEKCSDAVSDPRRTLLTSKYSAANDRITQRPKLPNSTVFTYFVQGLPLTGLPPKSSLTSLLNEWIERLKAIAESIASCPKEYLERINAASRGSSVGSSDSGGNGDQDLRIKMDCFTELIKLFSCFTDAQFVFMIDGCDQLKPPLFDWIPNILPQNMRFVVSCDVTSTVARELGNRPDCLAYTITGLSHMERAAAIRALFGRYGKVLNESTFNNQVSAIVNKRNAEIPLYLRLACDELRLHGTYEELDSQIRELPSTIPTLVGHIIARTEVECGSAVTRTALAFMCCSQRPLSGPELHALLDFTEVKEWVYLEEGSFYFFDESFPLDGDEHLAGNEQVVNSLLNDPSKISVSSGPNRSHLPSLAFQILLNNLRPLLSGWGDEGEEDADEGTLELTSYATQSGLLRFRNQEIEAVVNDILFRQSNSLSSVAIAGYQPFSGGWSSTKVSRIDPKPADTDHVSKADIHWRLATTNASLEHIVYHFFQAGKMHLVCLLLTSAVYIMSKFRAGFASSLLEDFNGYGLGDADLQAKWLEVCQIKRINHRLSSMKRFVATHSSMLSKYPFMFAQLALNDPVDDWIRRMGSIQAENLRSDPQRKHFRMLVCRNLDANADVIAPEAICDLRTSNFSKGIVPTAVSVAPTGRILAYGTESGNIVILETSSFRELWTVCGLGSAVLSCCFIPVEKFDASSGGSSFWLVSTTKDGAVSLLGVNASVSSSGRLQLSHGSRLLSLGDCHVSSATSCCWHPGRQILATGGLDCCVYLWMLPNTISELERMQSNSGRSKVPFQRLRTESGRVSSVAFRLPSPSCDEYYSDVLAVGCWDGTVRIHDMDTLRKIKTICVSKWAVSEIEFSPNGGSMFVTRDVKGRVCLCQSKSYTVLSALRLNNAPSTSFSPTIEFPEVAQCNLGRVCFSRPRGRYLIQSGYEDTGSDQLIVWNSQLGSTFGAWINSEKLLPQELITSFATDQFGHIAILGTNEGQLRFACSRTGRILPTNLARNGITRAQSISCFVTHTDSKQTNSKLLIAAGFSSGHVRIYTCTVVCSDQLACRNNRGDCYQCDCQVKDVNMVCSSLWHSDDSVGDSVSFSGGTLCVSVAKQIVASGGGNASCNIALLPECPESAEDFELFKFDELHPAVTAVDACRSLVAAGTKAMLVRLFSVDPMNRSVHVLADIPHAANDWITALAIVQPDCILGQENHPTVIVGSQDHAVRVYRIKEAGESLLVDGVDGPGGSVSCLSSSGRFFAAGSVDGLIKTWKFVTPSRVEELTLLDLTSSDNSSRLAAGSSRIGYVKLFTDQAVSLEESSAAEIANDDSFKSSSSQLSDEGDAEMSMDEDTPTTFYPQDSKGECSCICSLGKTSGALDTTAQDAPHLRLMVGQTCPPLNSDMRNPENGFRFRLLAPFVPECRAVLKGHLGSVATGLSTGTHTNWEDESLLVSISGVATGSNDLRLWRLPVDDPCSSPTPTLQHQRAITCICTVSHGATDCYCITGGLDGALVLWCLSASGWKALAKLDTSGSGHPLFPVTSICVLQYAAQDGWALFVANGKNLWILCLQVTAIANLAKYGTVSLQDLLNLDEYKSMGIDFIQKFHVEECLVDLCAVTKEDTNDVIVTLANDVFYVLHFAASLTGSSDYDTAVKKGMDHYSSTLLPLGNHSWANSLCQSGTRVIGIYNETPFVMNFAEAEVALNKLLLPDSFNDDNRVKSVLPILSPHANDASFYLTNTLCGTVSRLKLLNPTGLLVAQSEPFVSPTFITAVRYHEDPNLRGAFLIVMATSDGVLHVYQYVPSKQQTRPHEATQLQKVGLYPTGEQITQLFLLTHAQRLHLVAGCRSGRVNVYSIE